MSALPRPSLARRALGAKLRKLRIDRGETCAQVAEAIGYKYKAIERIEKGQQGTKFLQLDGLCAHFAVTDEVRAQLHSLRIRGNERGWWEGYLISGGQEVSVPSLQVFLEAEQDTVHLRSLEIELIPGLLQTPAYVRALQEAELPAPEEVRKLVRDLRRLRRETYFARSEAPKTEFILGSKAIELLDDLDPPERDEQIASLKSAQARPNVDIYVISRKHAAMAGGFCLFTLPDGLPPIVSIDALDGCRYVEGAEAVYRYEWAFENVKDRAVPLLEYL
ncbi:Scr1 family TA system antitoxin-like transcriptional regulator [Natronoglycomyces albus]|uniref:Helix-turn-helix domain-containing protein n=1 Tax=Natronoglycomyces albus TaxID=2811108 RepID=A0A895XP35_9ACTN|nr:Scr1 family TA system antitoxin-like transcriptional regulator [Natronoglycomyces albus]QSB04835.1 helix-turn-helix domain-containing protein [Natronoglycomyces albus]